MVINTHDFTSLFHGQETLKKFFAHIAHKLLSFWAPNSPKKKRKLGVDR